MNPKFVLRTYLVEFEADEFGTKIIHSRVTRPLIEISRGVAKTGGHFVRSVNPIQTKGGEQIITLTLHSDAFFRSQRDINRHGS